MEQKAYLELQNVQNSYWWFVAKREIIMFLLREYKNRLLNDAGTLNLCDMGCGMGVLLNDLSKYGDVYGMDCEPMAVKYCAESWGESRILYGRLPDEVPFAPRTFDVIVSSDCLEHIDDDLSSLAQIRNLLRDRNSFIILTVPALMCLWSYNDVFVHHKRRYGKKQLIDIVEKSGFHTELCSYYNFWLFPVIWFIRKLKNIFKIQKDDLQDKATVNWINKILYKIFSSEKHWLLKKNFPIGVSLILVATKGEHE